MQIVVIMAMAASKATTFGGMFEFFAPRMFDVTRISGRIHKMLNNVLVQPTDFMLCTQINNVNVVSTFSLNV